MAEVLNSTHEPERVDGKLTTWGAFAQHRRDAKGRGILFLFTFEQWLQVWMDSGHFEQRGPKKGQYVMVLFGDKGPYALGNVKIITAELNHHEGNIGVPRPKSKAHRRSLSRAHKGKVLSEAHRKAIGDGVRGKLKGVSKSVLHRKHLSEARLQFNKSKRRGR